MIGRSRGVRMCGCGIDLGGVVVSRGVGVVTWATSFGEKRVGVPRWREYSTSVLWGVRRRSVVSMSGVAYMVQVEVIHLPKYLAS